MLEQEIDNVNIEKAQEKSPKLEQFLNEYKREVEDGILRNINMIESGNKSWSSVYLGLKNDAKDAFVIKCKDYPECLDFIRKSIDLNKDIALDDGMILYFLSSKGYSDEFIKFIEDIKNGSMNKAA